MACVLGACAPPPASTAAPGSLSDCTGVGVELQVLGSGGPIPDDDRASSGYLIWIDGRARVLIDAGGGIFQRFGASGARLDDIYAVGLTHLHADHSSDLPALLKGAYFGDRTRDLPLLGPRAGGAFPSLEKWLENMFAADGSYGYLSWLLDGEGSFGLAVRSIDPRAREPLRVFDDLGLQVDAVGVQHGPVPALGYAVSTNGKKLVFSGDQNGNNPAFVALAREADVLVMHHAIPERADAVARQLHARPSQIAAVAAEAASAHLVLSHHMARSLTHLDESLRLIRAQYNGPITVAEDLTCISL